MIVSKAVNTNNTLPILNNVLLKAEGGRLSFVSTNLELSITYHIQTSIESEGQITIPAKLLTNYISYLKDGEVRIEVSDTDVQVKTSDSKTRIKGLPAAEFPPIPTVEKEGGVKIKAGDLKNAINQVVFAAALNTTRPILGGVFLTIKEEKLFMVSTDSYRLSEKAIPFSSSDGEVTCIVPAKTMIELGATLESVEPGDEVEIITSKDQVMFCVKELQMTSRLINGQFPNYKQIIPESSKTQVEFDVSALSLVLKRINIFAKENNNKVVLKISKEGVLITTESTQYGEGEINLKPIIQGEDNEIALNSQFLLDALSHMNSNFVVIEVGEKVSPVIVRPKEDKGYTHIIMPLKI